MRILLSSLVLVAGLNLIVARSFWNPNNDYFDYDLFKLPSSGNLNDFEDFMINDSLEEKSKEVVPSPNFVEHSDDNLDSFMDTVLTDLFKFNKQESEENTNYPDLSVKEDNEKSEEDVHSLIFWISSGDDNVKSDEVKPDSEVEIIDLTKSSEEKKDVGVATITISDKDIKQLTEFLIVLTAIDELLKVSVEDLNKTVDENEHDSKEKDLKEFDDFLKSLIDALEENEDDDDYEIATTTKKDSSEEDYDFTTPKHVETTTKKDSSEEDYDITTPQNDSSEEVEKETTTKKDSSEEDDVTTNKPNSEEDNDSKEFNIIDFVALSHTNSDEQEENFIKHKYEILDSISSSKAKVNDDSINDDDIVHQYVQIREVLDNEQDEISVNKLNLDKDFYNVISGDYNEEGLKKFEKDVVVLQENVERIKRHINGMENLNSKLYFKKLIKTALKDMQAKTNDLH